MHVWTGTELNVLIQAFLRVANAQASEVLPDLASKLHFIRQRSDKILCSRCRLVLSCFV